MSPETQAEAITSEVMEYVRGRAAGIASAAAGRVPVPAGSQVNIVVDISALESELDALEQSLIAVIAEAIGRLRGTGEGSG